MVDTIEVNKKVSVFIKVGSSLLVFSIALVGFSFNVISKAKADVYVDQSGGDLNASCNSGDGAGASASCCD